uniref:Protein POLLEN DEFECTIVE IN GUIDANCE 1 n=1 Tax=Ascaris lumbricoides TaxID=6252 RepID=A0A0M3HPB4_ASCLU
MAFLSLAVDACIDQLQTFHMYLMSKVERADDDLLNFALTYIVWMVYTMVVMLTSVIFVHYGPFVHVGSIVANLISRLVRNFKSAYANESRSCEMLAAGCAAGVACTFSAPIGGKNFRFISCESLLIIFMLELLGVHSDLSTFTVLQNRGRLSFFVMI